MLRFTWRMTRAVAMRPGPTLPPCRSITASIRGTRFGATLFDLPAAERAAGLVFRQEGEFPIGWFIVGYETWFRQPAVIRLE
jgi:hypothetical protein